jgi:hypothetical protein
MHLDLASVLNVISTIAIVAALIFTALQVRQGNVERRDQAATNPGSMFLELPGIAGESSPMVISHSITTQRAATILR